MIDWKIELKKERERDGEGKKDGESNGINLTIERERWWWWKQGSNDVGHWSHFWELPKAPARVLTILVNFHDDMIELNWDENKENVKIRKGGKQWAHVT